MNGQRLDREDLSRQRARLHEAAHDLADALGSLERETKVARRVSSQGRVPDLTGLHAAFATVRRCEEDVDLAQLDLNTASGQDA